MMFLGCPVLQGRATDKFLQKKIAHLERAMKRLTLLQAHDALCLLKNSIAMPKLLYLLRTSPCFDNPLLASFDDTLRRGMSLVLNVEHDDKQWSQATLPVHIGGVELRSTCMLAPSACLASAAATLPLQDAILAGKTGLHGLSRKKSAPRQIRHAQLNDIIWRAVKRAQYPSVKEPVGLSRSDVKRPDGATLIPWTKGKAAWMGHYSRRHVCLFVRW